MKQFDCIFSGVFQYVDDEEKDRATDKIFTSLNKENDKIRYVFLCYFEKEYRCLIRTIDKNTDTTATLENTNILKEPGVLIDFFKRYVFYEGEEAVEAKRHFFLTVGHGAGFAMFLREQKVRQKIALFLESNNIANAKGLADTIQLRKQMKQRHFLMANVVMRTKKTQEWQLPANLFHLESIDGENRKTTIEKGISNIIKDYYREDLLTVNSMRDILKEAFAPLNRTEDGISIPPIDMIIHINCYLQMFETGYAYKEVAKYLVASEMTIPVFGLDYQALFDCIAHMPDIDNRSLATLITTTFGRLLYSQPVDNRNAAISVNNLSKYEQIYQSLNDIAADFIRLYDSRLGTQKKLRHIIQELREFPVSSGAVRPPDGGTENSDVLDPGYWDLNQSDIVGFVDLIKFFKVLSLSEDLPIANREALSLLNKIWNMVCLASEATVSLFCDPNLSYEDRSEGLSIYFPSVNYGYNYNLLVAELIDDYITHPERFNVFTEKTKWDEFLQLYLQ